MCVPSHKAITRQAAVIQILLKQALRFGSYKVVRYGEITALLEERRPRRFDRSISAGDAERERHRGSYGQ